jgi:hypothetical protein
VRTINHWVKKMLNAKKIIINENLKHNASSNILFVCNADKLNFTRLIQSQSMRPLFFDKVEYDKFEITLQVICLHEGLIQNVNKDGSIIMHGDFFHKNDCSYTHLNFSTEINNLSWHRLKSDLLLLKTEILQFSVHDIIFNKVIKDDEDECIESSIEASFESYQIIKMLN